MTAPARRGTHRRVNAAADTNGLRNLAPLLKPRSVAVVGATRDANRIGGRPFYFLRRFGFPGPVWPVNPRYREIDGVRCYPRARDLPETPDMAVIAIPAAGVLDAVRDCQAAGVRAIVLYTSGFRETGAAGRALEAELAALAEAEGTLLCGPNCQGAANLLDRMQANFSSALTEKDMPVGPVGFVSQSGLFTGILAAEFRDRGVGLGYLVSTGNEAVVDFADVLAFMARDDRIRVVAGYLEGVRDGRKLGAAISVAREHGKPVVLLKVGRTAESAAAAASHTGALAGAYDVYRAALAQWGAVETDTIGELFDAVEAFAVSGKTARGDRIAMLTNSGGLGVFGADRTRAHGLHMARLAPETEAAIGERAFEFASASNPVDFTLQGLSDPAAVGSHLAHIARDDNVDVTLAFFGVQKLHVDALIDEIDATNRLNGKPLIAAWLMGDPQAPRRLRARGVPCMAGPAEAVAAARALVAHGAAARRAQAERPPRPLPEAAARAAAAPAGALSERDSRAILEAAGIPLVAGAFARSADEAAAAAEELGYPAVLKIDSPGIAHKTDIGGVAVGLRDAAAVRRAWADIMRNAAARAPDAEVAGCGVYALAPDGPELIAGIARDPVFGPVVLAGMGGVFAEVLNDTALGLPPLTADDARRMLESLRGYPILTGARGRSGAGIAALADVLLALSDLALACPQIAELDINPLRATPGGPLALDALIRISAPGPQKNAP